MASTEFALGDALAVQRWSTELDRETPKKMYFRKFMGASRDNMIVVKSELSKKAGEKITFGLKMKLSGDGIEDDNIIEGTSAEEAMSFYNQSLYVGQRRKGTKSKGRMSEQRVPYNMRREGRDSLSTWFAEDYDEQIMMFLAGLRGIDSSFHVGLSWTERANNSLTAANSANLIYGGDATSPSSLTDADGMELSIVDRLLAKIETMDPGINPFMVDGEKKYVLLMHIWQAYSLRNATSANDWIDVHKNTDGPKSMIYQNALGEWNGMILHKHRNVIRMDTTITTYAVDSARALCLGAQAGIIAWGGAGGPGRYTWNEEKDDRGNALAITSGAIYGTQRAIYNSKSFGLIAVDTYCDDPNTA